MKKFLAFALLASVGVAFWEYRRQRVQGTPETPDSDPLPLGSGLTLPSPGCTFCEAVNAFIEPVKDAVMTVKNNVFGTKYDEIISKSATDNGIEPDILYRLLRQESRFRPDIIEGRTKSPVGALGIAQFMPATAIEWLGSTDAALDPQKAIPGAARYLAWLQRQFNGDIVQAVAAYNWGIGNVKRKGLKNAPQETRNYVSSIAGVNISTLA